MDPQHCFPGFESISSSMNQGPDPALGYDTPVTEKPKKTMQNGHASLKFFSF
jgi:hypothetical protein